MTPDRVAYHGRVIALPPNRVWRTYPGGRVLDAIAGTPAPVDSHFPEDWIASLTPATNPVPTSPHEGLAMVKIRGDVVPLRDLVRADPGYFLGAGHVARFGTDPRLLVKFLDSAIRLHFQVHPDTAFARRCLGASAGKTEAYHVLGVRPDHEGLLYLGFAKPPTRDELRRLIEAQDIPALKARFNVLRIREGDTFIVPGGTPHALGAGLFVVEIQEPSDLVVRFEFERGGLVLPEPARFMNRGLDFCLDVFDLAAHPAGADRFRCEPRDLRVWPDGSTEVELIGPRHTSCFRLKKLRLREPVDYPTDGFTVAIITDGACRVAGGEEPGRTFGRHERFLLPAGLDCAHLTPFGQAEILLCQPPEVQIA